MREPTDDFTPIEAELVRQMYELRRALDAYRKQTEKAR